MLSGLSASAIALLGFAAWTILLVFAVLMYRTLLVFTGKTPANSWPRGTLNPSDPGIMVRIQHAHLNCLEGLPIFAAVLLVAGLSGKLPFTDTVAMYVLYARIAQTVTHLVGVNHWLVMLRATFFSIQLLLYAYMVWGLLQ